MQSCITKCHMPPSLLLPSCLFSHVTLVVRVEMLSSARGPSSPAGPLLQVPWKMAPVGTSVPSVGLNAVSHSAPVQQLNPKQPFCHLPAVMPVLCCCHSSLLFFSFPLSHLPSPFPSQSSRHLSAGDIRTRLHARLCIRLWEAEGVMGKSQGLPLSDRVRCVSWESRGREIRAVLRPE